MRPWRGLIAGAVLAAALATSARAGQGAADQAVAAAAGLRQSISDLHAATGAKDRIAALTRTIRAYENGLGALRAGLRQVTVQEDALKRTFAAKRDQLSALLGILSSMGRTPAPALLMYPDGPLDAIRAAMIAQDVTPALQAQADKLRRDLQELARLHKVQADAEQTLQRGMDAVQKARTDLSEAVSNRTDLPHRLTESPSALREIAASVKSLKGFADILSDRETSPGPDVPPFPTAKGHLPLPVDGTILRHAGQADAAGIVRPGIVVATRPRALVTAPWPSTIRYLGPLLDYGKVIVLEPGDGYLLVLAGMDVVYGKVGQVVNAGDPVGLMGGKEADPAEFMAAARKGGGDEKTETLYIELRKGTTPVDPEKWFEQTRE